MICCQTKPTSQEFINSTRVIDQAHFVDFINNFRKGCETQEPKPLYSINWQTPKVCFDKDLGFYFKLNVLHSKHNYFQDGSPMCKVLQFYSDASFVNRMFALYSF